MKVYLVRHGQSEGNKNNFHQTEDTPLSSEGISQAKFVAKRLLTIPFDVIYSSPYVRTKKTAEIISKITKREIEYWDSLVEVKRPTEIVNLMYEDPESIRIRNIIRENYQDPDWKFSDEESFNDLVTRAQKILDHLLQHHKDQDVVCVTHGGLIKMLACLVILGEDINPQLYLRFRNHTWEQNTGINVIEYTDKYGWALNHWNDIAHLGDRFT